jgi:hypothetical protein
MRIRLLVAGALLGGLACLAWAEDSQALLIDDFSTDQTVVDITTTGSEYSQVSGSGILGGERDMEVTLDSDVAIAVAITGDDLIYGQLAGSRGTALIVWDGPDDDPTLDPTGLDLTGLGGIDFTDGGLDDRIIIPLVVNNLSAPITLTAYTDDGNSSTATVWLTGGAPPQTQLTVLFTNFVIAKGTGADFTNIGAFSLFIDGSSSPGLAVGFDLIPEPSTGTLLLFGILMLASICRYRWAP